MRRVVAGGSAAAALAVTVLAATAQASPPAAAAPARTVAAPTTVPGPGTSPIKHVVIIYQENHSFDNVLGYLCVVDSRCDGATSGLLSTGGTIPLAKSPDIVPNVNHSTKSQTIAIDGGKMDGFDKVVGCQPDSKVPYQCFSQYHDDQIPNLAALARQYVISDRTFETATVPSFGAHVELVAQTLDGFVGSGTKKVSGLTPKPGWGCDNNQVTQWRDPQTGTVKWVPSCVPDYSLDSTKYPNGGAFQPTPVKHVDTLMDNMDAAGVSWKLYASGPQAGAIHGAYIWAICPTFADCLYTKQRQNMVAPDDILTDAQNGTLPAFSIVLPQSATGHTSQHNLTSMAVGDNWIGQVVAAIQNNPTEWASTAVFITYDDCGCFYDHVAPPSKTGIRVPFVIVSPYAKPGYTDSTTASSSSMITFAEHTLGVPGLGGPDETAYDYANSFDFTQTPLGTVRMVQTPISPAEQHYLATHPADEDDPT